MGRSTKRVATTSNSRDLTNIDRNFVTSNNAVSDFPAENAMHSQPRNFASPLAYPHFSSSNFLQRDNTTPHQQQQLLLQRHQRNIEAIRHQLQQHQYPANSAQPNDHSRNQHQQSSSASPTSSCESSLSCIVADSRERFHNNGSTAMITTSLDDPPRQQQVYSNRNLPPQKLMLRNRTEEQQQMNTSFPLQALPLPPRRPPPPPPESQLAATPAIANNKPQRLYDAFPMPPCTPSGISFALPKSNNNNSNNVMPPTTGPTTATTSLYAAPSCTATAFSSPMSPTPTSSSASSPASSSTICTETAHSESAQQPPSIKHYVAGRKAGLLVLLTALFAITAVASVLLIYLIGLRRGAATQRDLDESLTPTKREGRQKLQLNEELTDNSGSLEQFQNENIELQKSPWLRAFSSSVEMVAHDGDIPQTSTALDRMHHIIGGYLREQLDQTLSMNYPDVYIFSEVRGLPPAKASTRDYSHLAANDSYPLDGTKRYLQWTSYFRPNAYIQNKANDSIEPGSAPNEQPVVTEQNLRVAIVKAMQSIPQSVFAAWDVKLDTLTTHEEIATTPKPLTFDLALLPPLDDFNSTSPSTTTLNSATPTAMAVPSIYHMNAHRNIFASTNGDDKNLYLSGFNELTLGNRVPIAVPTVARRPASNNNIQLRTRRPFTAGDKSQNSVVVSLGVPGSLVSQIGGSSRRTPVSSPIIQTKKDNNAMSAPGATTVWPLTTSTSTAPVTVECSSKSFQCVTASGKAECIALSMLCNGRADCLDGSDESTAECQVSKQRLSSACSVDQFACDYSKCQPTSRRCDGREDCDDGTDEHNCTKCSNDAFLCANGFCRSRSAYCNKLNDCGDWSDEHSPHASNCTECFPDQFRCRNGQCVFGETCDGQLDCFDGSDERNCSCLARLERTAPDKICDGYKDCPDGEDENACLAASSCAAVIVNQQTDGSYPQHDHANNGMFQCANSDKCIRMARVCDAVIDCPDSSDEAFCYQLSADGEAVDRHKIVLRDEGILMWNVAGEWLPVCAASFNSSWSGGICRGMSFNASRKEAGIRLPARSSGSSSYAHFDIIEARYVVRDYCENDVVVHMSCQTLMCGKNPAAYTPTKPLDNRVFARIVGGNNADPAQWPWQAALYRDGQYVCGATLIDDQWLLSAAHCFYNYMHRYWTARLGAWRLSSPSPYSQMRRITHAIVLDTYDMFGSSDGDVALLRLDSPVALTHWSRPACLPPRQNVPLAGDDCYAIGWGLRSEDGAKADVLQEARVPVINNSLCNSIQDREYNGKITDYMICAGGDGVDSCQGDSGGPLLCRDGDSWYLAGVVSFGHGCGGGPQQPGVYTRTAKAKSWILDAMEAARNSNLPESAQIKPFNCFGFRCSDGRCLRKEQVCDGVQTCLDGADEKGCSVSEGFNRQCQDWHFPCHNGRCVDSVLHCDGADDCGDQSDEFDCTGSFAAGAASANDTTTALSISGRKSSLVLDDFSTVSPTSAALVEPTMPTIQQPLPSTRSALAFHHPKSRVVAHNDTNALCPPATHYQCGSSPRCILNSQRCDGRANCADRSDELGCQGNCPQGQFSCLDGKTCRTDDAWCNGYNDCGDWSDEPLNCTCKTDGTQFQCHSGACIAAERRCDGKPGDCADLSDEFNCSCVNILRGGSTHTDRLCDNYPDCANYADELDCAAFLSPPSSISNPNTRACDAVNEFQCPSGAHQCIKRAQVCDDVEDCTEKEDENNCMMLAHDSPSGARAAETAHLMLRPESGYLLLNINGSWYPTCADGWDKFSDLLLPVICTLMGQSIVRARVSFDDISAVNRKELEQVGGKKLTEFAKVRGTTLSHVTTCDQQMLVKIQCGESLCGIAQASITPLSATLVRLLTEQQQARFDAGDQLSLRMNDEVDNNIGPTNRRTARSRSSLQQLIMSSSGVTDDNSSPTSNTGRRIPRPQQTPWQAAVYVDGEFKCSATILSPRWAVTAAHCLPRPEQMHLHYISLRSGIWRLNADPPFQQIRAADVVIQRPYTVVPADLTNDSSSKAYVPSDIALVRLTNALETGDWTRAVCLPDVNDFTGANTVNRNLINEAASVVKQQQSSDLNEVFDGMECSLVAWNPAHSVTLSPTNIVPSMLRSAASDAAQQRLLTQSGPSLVQNTPSTAADNYDGFVKTLRSDRNIRTTATFSSFPSSRRVYGNMSIPKSHISNKNTAPRNQLYETAYVIMNSKQCSTTYFNGQLPKFSLCARPKTILPIMTNSQKLGRASSSMPSAVIAGLCEYEAGAALACPSSSGQITIIGIASYGPCQQPADFNKTGKLIPSIFTAILPLNDWINSYVKSPNDTASKLKKSNARQTDSSSLPSFPATSSTNCHGGESFRCELGNCLPISKRCDGIRQCLFGEDEAHCDTPSPSSAQSQATAALAGKCRQYDFGCLNGRCIEANRFCNGNDDCGDNSDEPHGCRSECVRGSEFQCEKTRKCIPRAWQCDSFSDCEDGSDERNCSNGCPPMPSSAGGSGGGRFYQCPNSTRCIPPSFVCDGIRDCADAADETQCGCPPGNFKCTNGKCIAGLHKFCDGVPDCAPDHTDEKYCKVDKQDCQVKTPTQFKCRSGECISIKWVCDGAPDCVSRDDEIDCDNSKRGDGSNAIAPEPPTEAACPAGFVRCKQANECINEAWICDGEPDCSDKSDETNCPVGGQNSGKDSIKSPAQNDPIAEPSPQTPQRWFSDPPDSKANDKGIAATTSVPALDDIMPNAVEPTASSSPWFVHQISTSSTTPKPAKRFKVTTTSRPPSTTTTSDELATRINFPPWLFPLVKPATTSKPLTTNAVKVFTVSTHKQRPFFPTTTSRPTKPQDRPFDFSSNNINKTLFVVFKPQNKPPTTPSPLSPSLVSELATTFPLDLLGIDFSQTAFGGIFPSAAGRPPAAASTLATPVALPLPRPTVFSISKPSESSPSAPTISGACNLTTHFRCHRRPMCLHRDRLCDGWPDCPNGSDEMFCRAAQLKQQTVESSAASTTNRYSIDCLREDAFLCWQSAKCVEKSHVCDSAFQCPHGEDERYCITISQTLPPASSNDSLLETSSLIGLPLSSSANGSSPTGMVMIRHAGIWYPLCATTWTHRLSQAVCRQQMFTGVASSRLVNASLLVQPRYDNILASLTTTVDEKQRQLLRTQQQDKMFAAFRRRAAQNDNLNPKVLSVIDHSTTSAPQEAVPELLGQSSTQCQLVEIECQTSLCGQSLNNFYRKTSVGKQPAKDFSATHNIMGRRGSTAAVAVDVVGAPHPYNINDDIANNQFDALSFLLAAGGESSQARGNAVNVAKYRRQAVPTFSGGVFSNIQENSFTANTYEAATPGEIPWQVMLYVNGVYRCAAFLLSSNMVLAGVACAGASLERALAPSAASRRRASPDTFLVARLGVWRSGSVSPFEQSVQISHIIPFRSQQQQQRPFNGEHPLPNVAVYVLKNPVVLFGRTLAPICVPQENDFAGLDSPPRSSEPPPSGQTGRPFSNAGEKKKPKRPFSHRPFSQNDEKQVRSRVAPDYHLPSTSSFLHSKDSTTRNARNPKQATTIQPNVRNSNINCRLTGWKQQNLTLASSSFLSLSDEDDEVLQFVSVELFPLTTCGVSNSNSNNNKSQPMLCVQADVPICPEFSNSLLTCQVLNGSSSTSSSGDNRWFALGIVARSDDANVDVQCRHRPNALLMSSLADRQVAEWLDIILSTTTAASESKRRPFAQNDNTNAIKNRRFNTKRYEVLRKTNGPQPGCTYVATGADVQNNTDGFLCEIDGLCVPAERVCDGLADCFDAADEINCTSACGSSSASNGGVVFPPPPSISSSTQSSGSVVRDAANEQGIIMPDYDFIAQMKLSPVADLQPISPNDETFSTPFSVQQKYPDENFFSHAPTLLPCDASTQCFLNDSSCICHPNNFRCDGLCKPSQMVYCNGRCECSDCSDEPFNCTCLASQFFCPLTGNCMSLLLMCDGKRDCGEFDEEENQCGFIESRATATEFDPDQPDKQRASPSKSAAVEVCSVEALQFSCTNPYGVMDFGIPGSGDSARGPSARRISAGFVVHSPVESSSILAAEEPNQSHDIFSRPQYANMNMTKSISVCRDILAWCDGMRDCPDGADEFNCKDVCPIGYHHCPALAPLRNCIPSTAWCDGKEDCRNGADELPDCECTEAQFRCSPTSPCMPKSKMCDHVVDCPNDSAIDEANCTCRDYLRTASTSARDDNLSATICDGVVDCDDGTDEIGCAGRESSQCGTVDGHLSAQSLVPSASAMYYQCEQSAQCIESDKVCNGVVDCEPGGDDEVDCLILAAETSKQTPTDLILSTKTPVSSGYVLVKQQHGWSAICYEEAKWSKKQAISVCRTIGYRSAVTSGDQNYRAPLPLTITVDGGSRESLATFLLSNAKQSVNSALKSIYSPAAKTMRQQHCASNEAVYVTCTDWDCSLPKLTTKPNEITPAILPFSAIIYVADEPVCEAVLIDAEFLLTTGSCLQSMLDYELFIRNISSLLPRQPRSSTLTKAARSEILKHQSFSKDIDTNLLFLQRTGLVRLAGMKKFITSSRSKRTTPPAKSLWSATTTDGAETQQQMPLLTARLGVRYLHNHNRESAEQLRRIVKWRIHPDFVFRAGTPGRFLVQNDVALLKMAAPVAFTKYVRPACLPPAQSTADEKQGIAFPKTSQQRAAGEEKSMCFTLGLGQNRFIVNATNVHSSQQCNRLMPVLEDAIQPEQICTDERGCNGLSGSALVCYNAEANSTNRRWTVEGIKSFRLSCGAASSFGAHPVYTATRGFVGDWISRVIADEKINSMNDGAGSTQHSNVSMFDWTSLTCPQFQCPLGRCIEEAQVMDGKWDCRGGADEPRLFVNEPTTTSTTTEATRPPRKNKRPVAGDSFEPSFKTSTQKFTTFASTTTTSTPPHGIVFPTFDDNKAGSVITLSPDLMTMPAQTTAITLPFDTTQSVSDEAQRGFIDTDFTEQLPQPPCPLRYFECDGRCLPERYQCDAIPDCSQLEDERNCLSCAPDQVPCPRSRACVERTRICDGHADCALGEDEEYCVILRNEFNSNTLMPVVDEPPAENALNNAVVVLDALGHTPSAEQGYLLIRQGERFEPVCTNVWTPSLAGAVCRHLQFGQVNFTTSLIEQVRKQQPQQPQMQFNNFSTAKQQTAAATAIPMPLTYATNMKSLIDTLQQIAEHSSPQQPQRFAELLTYDGRSSRAAIPVVAATCTKVKVTCMEPQCGVIQTGFLTTENSAQQQQSAENNTIHYFWPWAAALFQNNRFICTGYTLWNRHWLLLPLHCSRRLQRQTTVVRIGASRLSTTSPYEISNRLTGYVNHPTLPFLLGRLAEPLRPSISETAPAATATGVNSVKSPQRDVQLHRLICSPQQLLPANSDDTLSFNAGNSNNSRQGTPENNVLGDQIDLIANNVDECRIVGWLQSNRSESQQQRVNNNGLIQVISVKLHSQSSCVEQQLQQQRQGRSTTLRSKLRCVEASSKTTVANQLSCSQHVGHAVFCRAHSTVQWSLYGMAVAFTECKSEQRIWLVEPLIGAGVEWTESIIKQFSSFNFLRNISIGLDCNFDKGTTCGYRPRPHSLVALSSAASPPLSWTPELSSFTQFDKTVRNSISAHLILPTFRSDYYRNATHFAPPSNSAVPAELLAASQFGQTKPHQQQESRKLTASAQLVSPIISISTPDASGGDAANFNDSKEQSPQQSLGMCLRFHYRTGMYSRLNVLRRDAIGLTETLWSSLGPEPVSPNTNRMWASGRVVIPPGKYEIIFEGILTKPNRSAPRQSLSEARKTNERPSDWPATNAPTLTAPMAAMRMKPSTDEHYHFALPLLTESAVPPQFFLPVADNYGYYVESFSSSAPEIWLDDIDVVALTYCKAKY